MLGDPEFFFLKHWAWLDTADYEEALLGAFVRNFADPAHEGMIPEPDELSHWAKYGKTKTLDVVSFLSETPEAINRRGKFVRYRYLADIKSFFENVKNGLEVKTRVTEGFLIDVAR